MKDKICIVKGMAGMGNRLCTIAGAISYCNKTRRKLFVDWRDEMYGAKGENVFYQYFDLDYSNTLETITDFENETDIYPYYYDLSPTNFSDCYDSIAFDKKNRIRYLIHIPHFFPAPPSWADKNRPEILLEKGGELSYFKREKIVVYVDYVPMFNDFDMKRIKIKENFSKGIVEWMDKKTKGSKYIAVHVRATDKKYNADVDKLILKVKQYLNNERDAGGERKVFLATDNRDIQEVFFDKFGERNIVFPKALPEKNEWSSGIHFWNRSFNSPDERKKQLEAALADMVIMQNSDLLLFQQNSTFSRIVSIWRNRENSIDWTSFKGDV